MWKDKDISTLGLRAMSNVKKPEPVAWVRKHPDGALTNQFLEDGVIEEARKQSGAWRPLITADQSEAYANALAAEGIRNTLKIAAAIAASKTRIGALRSVEASLAAKTAQEIETQILALIIE